MECRGNSVFGQRFISLFGRNAFAKLLFLFVMFGVDAIITEHLEVFFRDVYNEPFDEIKSRNTFFNGLIIFVSSVMKSNIITIIFINA